MKDKMMRLYGANNEISDYYNRLIFKVKVSGYNGFTISNIFGDIKNQYYLLVLNLI